MSKYHSTPVEVNGIRFDSKREAARYKELLLLQRGHVITDLKRQVPYLLIPAQYRDGKCKERSCTYVADFTYRYDGKLVVEDCKGLKTDVYRIKKKLMLWLYEIEVLET